jgi:hypothetical protein
MVHGHGDSIERLRDLVYDAAWWLEHLGIFCSLKLFGTVKPEEFPPITAVLQLPYIEATTAEWLFPLRKTHPARCPIHSQSHREWVGNHEPRHAVPKAAGASQRLDADNYPRRAQTTQ